MNIRICLVNPPLGGAYPPLNITYLAAYLRKYGSQEYDLRIVDGNVAKDMLKAIKEFNPHIVGFTALSPQITHAVKLSCGIREERKDILQVIGGVHVNADTKNTLQKGSFDLAVLGEGENTFLEIVEQFADEGRLPKDKIPSIDGVAFLEGDEIVYTKSRKQIENLDSIPFPARELLEIEFYLNKRFALRGSVQSRLATVMCARGCPYSCIFCCTGFVFKKVRDFSVNYTVSEVEEVVGRFGARMVYFYDDTFIVNKKKIYELCQLMIKRGLHKKVRWTAQARANLIGWDDLDLLKLMKKAGCIQVEYGFESGSQRILGLLKENLVTVEDNQRAIDVTHGAGLRVLGTFIVGTLGETREELKQTIYFINKNLKKLGYFQTFIATPYPGTKLYQMCKEKKLILEDYFAEEEKRARVSGRVVYNDAVSSKEVIEALDYLDYLGMKNVPIKDKLIWVMHHFFKNLFKKGGYQLGERLKLYFKFKLYSGKFKDLTHG